MASRNFGRSRGAEAGVCVCHVLACFVSHLSKRALFEGPRVKKGDQGLDCSRAVLHSCQCSQTSAGVWHRAQPPQRPGLRVGGALASEAGDVWVRTAFFFFCIAFTFPPLLQVKNQRRWGDEEAVGSLLTRHTFLADSVVIFLFVPSRASMRFPLVSRSESRAVFLAVSVIWCCLPGNS